MPSDLIFKTVNAARRPRLPYILIRRPNPWSKDKANTIGKIRDEGRGYRLSLNGQDSVTREELGEIYLVMAEIEEAFSARV